MRTSAPVDGLAHGVGELLVGVVRRAHADHGDLGHAVAVGDARTPISRPTS